MSGVIGIDIGSSDCIVASVGKGMVDIVRNEVSERITPSVVGFTHRNRLLGEAAASLIKSNYSNTCRFPKLLLGKKLSDPCMAEEKFYQLCEMKEANDGFAGYAVKYMDQERVFSATEITAMLLTKLKDTTENFTGHAPKEAVIACPSYFTDIERRALLDAAEIAGIKVLRIMNDTSATALGYGIYRSAEFDEKVPVNVAFVSMGHSHFSCSISSFTRQQLTVLSESSDRSVGGRAIDRLLMEHFANEFASKNKGLSPLSNIKSRYKLEEAVTKMKKVLSANSEAAINLECLLEEKDLSAVVKRADLEHWCAAELVPRIQEVIQTALSGAGLTIGDIAHVEIVGGCSRIPFVQNAVSECFGNKELSRTLNADECVARGCALQAAIISPLFKVRPFEVVDYTHHPIIVSWTSVGAGSETEETLNEGMTDVLSSETAEQTVSTKSVTVFPRRSAMNVTKVLTFYRNGPFDITAEYGDPQMLPQGTCAVLGKFHLEAPKSLDNKKIKLRVKLSVHGTFSVETAHLVETEEYDEIVSEKVPKQANAQGESATDVPMEAEYETVEVVHKKKREKKTEVKVACVLSNGLSLAQLNTASDAESSMIASDREERDRDNARNDLESFLYESKERLNEVWAPYLSSETEKESLLSQITAAEDWLYDKFEDGTKVDFADKLVEVKGWFAHLQKGVDEAIRRKELEIEQARKEAAAAAATANEQPEQTSNDVNMESEAPNAAMDEMD